MRKYGKDDIEGADAEIRSYLRRGLTYHNAAKEVSKRSPIAFLSLRRMAYRITVEEADFTPGGLQHPTDTEHGGLLAKCKEKLEVEGYNVISEQNEIRRIVQSKGSKGNPDLIAIKGNDLVSVEVVERAETSATFVDQLARFAKIGKVVVVFPMNTTNIEIWGIQDLPPPKHRSDPSSFAESSST